MSLEFRVTLLTFTWPDLDYRKTATIVREFAKRAEQLGCASLDVWDHLIESPGLYGGSWLDPLLCLSHAAYT